MPGLAGRDRADAAGLHGRIELARGERDAARAALEDAASRHEAEGRSSLAADDASVLVQVALDERRLVAAREADARVARDAATYPEGRAIADYYTGEIEREATDPHAALRALRAAEERAQHLGLVDLRRAIVQSEAAELRSLGRAREGVDRLLALEASDGAAMDPCARGDLVTNVGWNAYEGRGLDVEWPAPERVDPAAWFSRAVELYRAPCGRQTQRANALLNLAWADLDRGDLAAASAHVAQAKGSLVGSGATRASELADLEAQIAEAAGRPADALPLCARLAQLASQTGAREDAWRAADLRAVALTALGRADVARRASDEAEAILDELSRGIPLGDGREGFLAARHRSTQRRVALLLDQGEPAEALIAARRARARMVTEVQRVDRIGVLPAEDRARWEDALGAYRRARDAMAADADADWGLSEEALAKAVAARKGREVELRAAVDRAAPFAPRPALSPALPTEDGVVLLAFFPLARGWATFAATRAKVTAARVPDVPAGAPLDALGRALLEPHRTILATAKRVHVLAAGAARALDVHALVLDGAPLVARAVVEYPLDLDGADEPPIDGPALVVGDPRSDLPSALAEADSVARALAPREVILLEGPAATRSAVAAALARASLAHYAGHGVFAGRDGWESALPLAARDRLTLGDVLALPRVPHDVVLSGCETARSGAASSAESLGLAQAFVAAGSAHVVAATRAVDDPSTRVFMEALYASAAKQPRLDLAAALRDAQLAVAAADPKIDWAAFRALRR
jgi:hypothetical protein